MKTIKRPISVILSLLLVLAAILTVLIGAYAAQYETVFIQTPFDEYALSQGETKEWDVPFSNIPIKPKMDVMYVIDTTGSMVTIRAVVANTLIQFTDDLMKAGATDIHFGVAYYGDIAADNPWFEIPLPLGGHDLTTVQNTLRTLPMLDGGDIPEDTVMAYMRAINDTTWREDSQHVVIVVTDAETHVRPEILVGGFPVTDAGARLLADAKSIKTALMTYKSTPQLITFAAALGTAEHLWLTQAGLQERLAAAVIPPVELLDDYLCQARIESVTYESDNTPSTDVSVSFTPASFVISGGESNKFHFTAVGKMWPTRYDDTTIVKIGFYVNGFKVNEADQYVKYKVDHTDGTFTYTVEYYKDGVKFETSSPIAALYGTAINSFATPQGDLTGYKLDTSNQPNVPLVITEVPANNVIKVYYVKDTFTYTVEYYKDGIKFETSAPIAALYNAQINTYPAPQGDLTGYKLDTSNQPNVPLVITEISANNVIRVYYVKDTFTYMVMYYKDGVKFETSALIAAPFMATISTYPAPQGDLTGYKLDTNNPPNVPLVITDVPASNVIRVYYVKDAFTYTVEYYKDGLMFETSAPIAALYMSQISTYPDPQDDLTGYKPDTNNPPNIPLVITEVPANNVIKVYYVREIFTVTYYANGGTGGDIVIDVVYGQEYIIASNTFTAQAGYTFSRWNTSNNGTGTPFTAGAQIKITGNVELYAQWTRRSGGGGEKEIEIKDPEIPSAFITDHVAYIIGYPIGDVRPVNNITRAEVATVFFRLLDEKVREDNWTQGNKFPDVNAGNWFNNAVSVMSNMGIVNGYEDGTFRPNGAITRAELAAIAARFARMLNMGGNNDANFSDISGHWAQGDIIFVTSTGWMNGYPDETFKPNQPITRVEFMTLVNRMTERIPQTQDDLLTDLMIVWSDNMDTTAWFYLAVQEATNSHIPKYKDIIVPGLDFGYEFWVEMMDNPDWASLEREWANGYTSEE